MKTELYLTLPHLLGVEAPRCVRFEIIDAVRSEVGRSGRYGYYVPLHRIMVIILSGQFKEEGGILRMHGRSR